MAGLQPLQRKVVSDNLRRVLGPEADEATLRRCVRAAYVSYGRYWADAARLDPNAPGLLERHWTIEGAEHFLQAASSGRGVVLALPHLGSWEIGGIWAASVGHPLTTVAEPAEPAALFEWFVAKREALGIRVLPLGGSTATELAAILREGGTVALLADRDVVGDGIEVELFGATTRLPAGPAVLALRTGAVLLPCAVYHGHGDRHHGVIRPPLDTQRRGRLREDAQRVTTALAHELERLILRAPEQWHVFQPNWPSSPLHDRRSPQSEADRAPDAAPDGLAAS
jgi:lauroyl/myristoyl acyltransferase